MGEKESAKIHALNGQPDPTGSGSENEGAPALSRGIYLLPNLITSGALFSGFYAIVYFYPKLSLAEINTAV